MKHIPGHPRRMAHVLAFTPPMQFIREKIDIQEKLQTEQDPAKRNELTARHKQIVAFLRPKQIIG